MWQKVDVMLCVFYDCCFVYVIDGYGLLKNELVVMFFFYQQESWVLVCDYEKINDICILVIFQYENVVVELDLLFSFFLGVIIGGCLCDKLVYVDLVFIGIDKLKVGEVVVVVGMRS